MNTDIINSLEDKADNFAHSKLVKVLLSLAIIGGGIATFLSFYDRSKNAQMQNLKMQLTQLQIQKLQNDLGILQPVA